MIRPIPRPLGKASYALYITHFPLLLTIRQLLGVKRTFTLRERRARGQVAHEVSPTSTDIQEFLLPHLTSGRARQLLPHVKRGVHALSVAREEASRLGAPASKRVHKSWFGPHDCLYDNPDIVDCRKRYGVSRFLARTYSGPTGDRPETFDLAWTSQGFAHAPLEDRYPYLDEYKLIAYWEQKILDSVHRSQIRSGRFYQAHKAFPSHVDVRFLVDGSNGGANGGLTEEFRCRLLLDASGHDSDIRKAYDDAQPHMYRWTVFGAVYTHPEGEIVAKPTQGHPLVIGDPVDHALRLGRELHPEELRTLLPRAQHPYRPGST